MTNFRESKLVFKFEGGNAESFVPKIQAVETKVQAEKEKADPGKGKDKENVVNEGAFQKKIRDIETRIKDSPVSDKYQEQIGKALTDLLGKREQDLKKVDTKKEGDLVKLFGKIEEDLNKFDQQPGVREVYETIEPFFKHKDQIKSVVNLKTYRRSSGHWRKINDALDAKAGIKRDQIDKIQKLLKVRRDGKVGPQTINAISEMLETGRIVHFDDKETFYEGESKSEEQKTAELGQLPEEDKEVTDGKTPAPTTGNPGERPGGPQAEKAPNIPLEQLERITADFQKINTLFDPLNVSTEKYKDAYLNSGLKVPSQVIVDHIKSLTDQIATLKDTADFVEAEQNEISLALGMFCNGNADGGKEKVQAIINKVKTEHEAHEHLAKMETVKAAIGQKAEAAMAKGQTYLNYAYTINGKVKSLEKDKQGNEHKYDFDKYLVARGELTASLEEFVKSREEFVGKDNLEQREIALARVLKSKFTIDAPTLVEDKSNQTTGLTMKREKLNLPQTRAELEQMKLEADMNLIFARRQNYLETGDEKFKEDFEKSQQILTMNNTVGAQVGLEEGIKADSPEGETLDPEKEALKDTSQKDLEAVIKDLDQAERFRASNPEQCYTACVALQEKLEGNKKFGETQLAVLPNVQAAYLKTIQGFLDKNKALVLDSITNNPQMNDYKESASHALGETQGFVNSLGVLFNQIAQGDDDPSESFMKHVHESARQVLGNQNLQKLASHPATGFIRKFKYLDFKGTDDFRGGINLAVNGMYHTMDKITQYQQNANQLCSQSLQMEGSASTFKTFCKQTGKELVIVTAAVGAAVLAGMAVASTGGLAGAGIMVMAGNFAITTGVTSLAAAVTTQYTRAIIDGNADHLDTNVQLKAWGQGAMYSALGGVGGVVLGKGMGVLASKVAQSSTGLSQKAAMFVAQRTEDMFARASSAGTKVEGGILSQLRHLAKEVASETGEELTEDAIQKIGEGLAPSHPELGFALSLIPSATRTARGTFMERTVGIGPRPGITGSVSDNGVQLKYSKAEEVVDLLRSRNMPAEVIAKFEATGKIDGKIGGVNFRIEKTNEPATVRQILSEVKGMEAQRQFGLNFNEQDGSYEFKNGKDKAKVIDFFKSRGALVETNENGETVITMGTETMLLKCKKPEVKTETDTNDGNDKKTGGEDENEDSEKRSFTEWVTEQLRKIPNLNLREKASTVIIAIGKGTKAALDIALSTWKTIQDAIGKFSAELKARIDKQLEKSKQKAEEPVLALEDLRKFETGNKEKAQQIIENNGKEAEAYITEAEALLSNVEKNPDFRKNPELSEAYDKQKAILDSVKAANEFKNKTNALVQELYPDGIQKNMKQGRTGNCYLIAALKSLKGNLKLMKEMVGRSIKKVGDGQWEVTFLGGDPTVGPILITKAKLKEWQNQNRNIQGARGDMILELAYASYRSRLEKRVEGQTMIADKKGDLAVEGGFGHRALGHLLGDIASKHTIGEYTYGTSHATLAEKGDSQNSLDLLNGNLQGVIITANTTSHALGDKAPPFWVEGQEMVHSHAYSVMGYDAATGRVTLANPHDSGRHFTLSRQGFLNTFAQLSYVHVSRLAELNKRLSFSKSPELTQSIVKSYMNQYSIYELAGIKEGSGEQKLKTSLEHLLNKQRDPVTRSVLQAEIEVKLRDSGITINLRNYG